MTNTTDPAGRLVFGDDGSAGAERAWQWLTAQQWPTWQIDVLTVTPVEPSLADVFAYQPLREYRPERPRTAPRTMSFGSIRHLTTAFEPRVVLGEIQDADLVVVGARGDGVLKELRLGSAADWLIRRSRTPVVVAIAARPVREVLLCVDEQGRAGSAAEVLSQMPWVTRAAVTILAVCPEYGTELPAAEQAANVLKAAGAGVQIMRVIPDPQVIAASPKFKIFEFIDKRDPDLVVVGTRGLSGVARLVAGSTAGAIAEYVSTAVMVVRDQAGATGAAA